MNSQIIKFYNQNQKKKEKKKPLQQKRGKEVRSSPQG